MFVSHDFLTACGKAIRHLNLSFPCDILTSLENIMYYQPDFPSWVSVASRSSFDESDASVSIFAKGEGRGLTPSVYPQSDTETVIVPVALLK